MKKSKHYALLFLSSIICLFLFLHYNGYFLHYNGHTDTKQINGFISNHHKLYKVRVPFSYPEEVDFRIIVITYNRPVSLQKALDTLQTLHLDGDTARLEIWIDRNKKNQVDKLTVDTASNFTWKLGPTRVHIWESHAYLMGQWIDTWLPRKDTKEIALILEDDMSISPHSYRYLKAAHAAYKHRNDFAGVSLTSEFVKSLDGRRLMFGRKNDSAYMYVCMGTWGYSPSPPVWRRFQVWFHEHYVKKDFRPYIPEGKTAMSWYKSFEARGTEDSYWEMWFHYFTNKVEKRFSVFSNHFYMTGDRESCMSINRKEVGLHFPTKGSETICKLLTKWKPEYAVMPKDIYIFNWAGKRVDNYTKS